MPIKQPRKSSAPRERVEIANSRDYRNLIAFLDLAEGFNLGLAYCDLPSLRDQIIHKATEDAAKLGIRVETIAFSASSASDFIDYIRTQLKHRDPHNRIALMVTGLEDVFFPSMIGQLLKRMRFPCRQPEFRPRTDRQRFAIPDCFLVKTANP